MDRLLLDDVKPVELLDIDQILKERSYGDECISARLGLSRRTQSLGRHQKTACASPTRADISNLLALPPAKVPSPQV